jgi:extracellular factor (EF) 3-hydroxypalmitic acid methyl ester biosynthesis protein
MELKERCDVATGAGSAVGGLDPALLLPQEARAEPPLAPAPAPYPVPRPVVVTADEIRRYEDLDGADGRSVFFRPQRYSAEDLLPLRGTVTLDAEGEQRQLPLLDVSQSGVAVAWPEALSPPRRQRLPVLLRFDGHVAFRGEARVGSVRERDGRTMVGLSFEDFLLDVEELLELRGVRAWADERGLGRLERPWSLDGGERFKSLASELRLFLEDARVHLDGLERELPWHVLRNEDHPARAALLASLRRDFVAPVLRLSEQLDEAVRTLPDGHACAPAKEWSLRQVHDFLMMAPCCHRARHKPFGYPGDYEVMNFIYTRQFEGASLFARAVGLTFTSTVAARAVRHRKDLVKRELKALLTRHTGDRRPVRILSIAAGPAQELWELFGELDDLPVPVEVVLFEQDKNALAQAWRRLQSVVEARFPHGIKLTFLHDSIKRLLRDPALFTPFGEFDLVYSCGLFDYLAQRTATILTRRLAASTRSGGQLLVANMVDHPTRWLMEHHLDWLLIYRTREELLEIGRQAVPAAQVRLLEEESRANPFFELVKR